MKADGDSHTEAQPQEDQEALERALAARFDELAALTRRLEAARHENLALRAELRRVSQRFENLSESLERLARSISGRLGDRLMRLCMRPSSLGRGETLLDRIKWERRPLDE